MNYIDKAMNFFIKRMRSGVKVHYFEKDGHYWVIDGYVCVKIPLDQMLINPKVLTCSENFTGTVDSFLNITACCAEKLTFVEKTSAGTFVPLKSGDVVVWANVSFLDIFGNDTDILISKVSEPIAISRRGDVIGFVMPVKRPEKLPSFLDL